MRIGNVTKTCVLVLTLHATPTLADTPDFNRDVAPILNRYCAGCHNAQDAEGKFSLASFDSLKRGGESGAAFVAGKADESRMIQYITGAAEPLMPPEDEPAPTRDEIAVLKAWIDAGAIGPKSSGSSTAQMFPRIQPTQRNPKSITAIDWSQDGTSIAVARFGEVILLDAANREVQWRVSGLPGKVNSVHFSSNGQYLVCATGVAGVQGKAIIYSVAGGIVARTVTGHNDTLYAAVLNHDGTMLATAGYDRSIMLWNAKTGEALRTLTGHNDAIYDLDFNSDSTVLASASGDETIKLWNVNSGERLDTRSEPLAEQYTVRFSPDGRYVLGGGADNRIRVWQVVSKQTPQINPIVFSRFAHEGAVVGLRFSANGRTVVSISEDKTIKLWETTRFTPTHVYGAQDSAVMSLAVSPDADRILIGKANGKTKSFDVSPEQLLPAKMDRIRSIAIVANEAGDKTNTSNESEPNNKPTDANQLTLPATVTGVINAAEGTTDHDLFRFNSMAGQKWIVEVKAARDKSKLDSFIEVLTSDGKPIEQVLLRAVRDSYFTFRGKDSNTSDDYRIHNWREMELNEYIYSKGEVNRLWMYPRGPDSGFRVYPGSGTRHSYFATTPGSHALHEPCYIVEPFPPGTKFLPNGLPVFTLYYQNDDDGARKLGKDSRLSFAAPADGEYLVRIRDTRSFQGDDFKYKLTVRAPKPEFSVKLGGGNPKLHPGSGREFSVTATRTDDFNGEIKVEITGLPEGYSATSPLIIESGQSRAFGTIRAAADAKAPAKDAEKAIKIVATAMINGKSVSHDVNKLGKITLDEKPSVIVELLPEDMDAVVKNIPGEPLELQIEPGQTIQARVRVERNGFKNRIGFGKDDSGRNLPHGVFVDNIGLNGLLIVESESERNFYITAAKWVPEQTRVFHLKADSQGGHVSQPVVIHVRKPGAVASASE